MQIGEVARRSRISVRMLRYYEAQGLLRPRRTGAGYRAYAEKDIEEACRIRQLADAGLTVEAMRDLLPCVISPAPRFHPCERLRGRLAGEIEKLDRKLQHLQASRDLIAGYIKNL